MKHSSDLLLHFVDRANRTDPASQRDTCLKILREGFRFSPQVWPRNRGIGSVVAGVSVQAVCFADIPLRLAEAHAARYGKCAIGIRKALVKKWGGNPVLYLVDRLEADEFGRGEEDLRGTFGHSILDLVRQVSMPDSLPEGHWFRALNTAQRGECQASIYWALSHVKEMFDLGSDVDSEDAQGARRDRYYMEREWRVCLGRPQFNIVEQKKNLVNKTDDHYYLPIPRGEARLVLAPNERVKSEIHCALMHEGWPPAQFPTLMTFEEADDL